MSPCPRLSSEGQTCQDAVPLMTGAAAIDTPRTTAMLEYI
jgi:hypothetical protein